jgi:hypothetical protein
MRYCHKFAGWRQLRDLSSKREEVVKEDILHNCSLTLPKKEVFEGCCHN